MTRILLLIDNLDHGGAQNLLYNYVRHMDKSFVFVICNLSNSGFYSNLFRELGLRVYDLSSSRYNLLVFFKVIKIIIKEKIDIIHSQLLRSSFFSPFLGKLCGKKTMFTHHSGFEVEALLPYFKVKFLVYVYRFLQGWCWRFSDRGIVLTEGERVVLSKINPSLVHKLSVLPNGIDLDVFNTRDLYREKESVLLEFNLNESYFIIATVGRLSLEKDQHILIKSFHKLLLEYRGYRKLILFIAGSGPEELNLKTLVSKLSVENNSVENNIVFLGERGDIKRLLTAFDLFVLPSCAEPFGIVLLEAMAMGVPIIAMNSGGPRDIIQDGVDGLLVPAKDIDMLKDKMHFLIKNEDKRLALSKEAYNTVCKKYDIKVVVEELERIYKSLL